jgi:DNA ligase (NAD+)
MNTEQIKRLIHEANRAYYDGGESTLSDAEYDALTDEAILRGIDVTTLTGPPKRTPWSVVNHSIPMDKIGDAARDMRDWRHITIVNNLQKGMASLKYDGMSIVMYYNTDGDLEHCLLRGDGEKGEDVWRNARYAMGVAHRVKCGPLAVRGELVITMRNMEVLNQRRAAMNKDPYKTPRNAVAMVRKLEARPQDMALFTIRAISVSVIGRTFTNQIDGLEWLQEQSLLGNFDIIKPKRCTPQGAWMLRCELFKSRNNWKYLLDGVVFRGDQGELVKLKFPADSGITTVTAIVEQLGRTGVVTPVIEFETIKLAGADVSRATAHNVELMWKRLRGIGIGARVLVSRRGDVIPHVERVVEMSDDHWTPSGECPSCGHETAVDGAITRCANDPTECPGTTLGLILKFCKELGVDGIGPGVAAAMVDSGVIKPHNLFEINPDALAQMRAPGGHTIGETIANKIIRNLNKARETSMGDLLGSMGIRACGKSIMAQVCSAFPDPSTLATANLEEVEGIGPERAENIRSYMMAHYENTVVPLLDYVVITKVGSALHGMTFCITGSLTLCGREQMHSRIKLAGGQVKGSVSKKVTHVVCNDLYSVSSKMKRARTLGCTIITEKQLIDMLDIDLEEDDGPTPDGDF